MEDEHCNLAFVVFLEFRELHDLHTYYYILLLYCKSLQKYGSRKVHVFYILDICVFF